MRQRPISLERLDALIVKTEQRIAEQVTRLETARYGALASRLAMCRLADLRIDLRAYRQARGAVAEMRHSSGSPGTLFVTESGAASAPLYR